MVYETQPTQHQFNVDHGLVWTENLPFLTERFPEPLATTLIGSSVHKCEWTPPQKMQFMELIGRKGSAKIAEIAKIMGKSVMQCLIYLEQLDSSPRGVIEYTSIPPAPDSVLEFAVPQPQVDPLAKSSKSCVFRWVQIGEVYKPLETNGSTYLETAFKSRLETWINDILKIAVSSTENVDHPVFITDKHVFQTMEMFPNKFADLITQPVVPIGDEEFDARIKELENASEDAGDPDVENEPDNPEFDPSFVEGEYCKPTPTLGQIYYEASMLEGFDSFVA